MGDIGHPVRVVEVEEAPEIPDYPPPSVPEREPTAAPVEARPEKEPVGV